MKTISVICLRSDTGAALDRLYDMGVLHLIPVEEAKGQDLDKTRKALARAQSALDVLTPYRKRMKSNPHAAQCVMNSSGDQLVDDVLVLTARQKMLTEQIAALSAEKAAIEPYGDFDPSSVIRLGNAGVTVRLYRIAGKDIPETPAGVTFFVLRQEPGQIFFAAVGDGPVGPPAVEFPLPSRPLAAACADLETAQRSLSAVHAELGNMVHASDSLGVVITRLADQERYLVARETMGREKNLAYLQGYCPVNLVGCVATAAAEHGWGLVVEDPAHDDRVPTLIRYPRWVRPMKTLFDLLKISPGYREVDVGSAFYIFLSIFFAMIVGDAGYGFVFLLLILAARAKFRNAPPQPFTLMTVFSICTVIWGVLTGTYFGLTELPCLLPQVKNWLADTPNMMSLCLFIGAVHLSLAHAWGALRVINSTRAIAQLAWVLVVWAIFFAARFLLLNAPLPRFFIPLLVAGMIGVVVFMTPPRCLGAEWINHALLPLTIMSFFGDVLSYLRLFALGVASVELAKAFNTMIVGSIGFHSVLSCIAAAVLLLASHTLNIFLSLISVLVHGLRLNALEFSTHLGLEWAGIEYLPFARKTLQEQQRA